MDALVARSHRCGFGGYSLLSTSLSPPPILLKYNLSAIRSLGLKTHSLFTWSRHRRALAAFRCAPLNNDILPQSQVAFIYHIQTFPTDRANYKPLFTLGKPTIDTTTRLEIGQKYIDSIQHGDPILYRRYIGKVRRGKLGNNDSRRSRRAKEQCPGLVLEDDCEPQSGRLELYIFCGRSLLVKLSPSISQVQNHFVQRKPSTNDTYHSINTGYPYAIQSRIHCYVVTTKIKAPRGQ
jgi:hypothetical protein